jgi:hypothetical protein
MQNQPKNTRRIDLSNCKLLSTYGRDLSAPTTNLQTKVGTFVKPGILTKTGLITKIGIVGKPEAR